MAEDKLFATGSFCKCQIWERNENYFVRMELDWHVNYTVEAWIRTKDIPRLLSEDRETFYKVFYEYDNQSEFYSPDQPWVMGENSIPKKIEDGDSVIVNDERMLLLERGGKYRAFIYIAWSRMGGFVTAEIKPEDVPRFTSTDNSVFRRVYNKYLERGAFTTAMGYPMPY